MHTRCILAEKPCKCTACNALYLWGGLPRRSVSASVCRIFIVQQVANSIAYSLYHLQFVGRVQSNRRVEVGLTMMRRIPFKLLERTCLPLINDHAVFKKKYIFSSETMQIAKMKAATKRYRHLLKWKKWRRANRQKHPTSQQLQISSSCLEVGQSWGRLCNSWNRLWMRMGRSRCQFDKRKWIAKR